MKSQSPRERAAPNPAAGPEPVPTDQQRLFAECEESRRMAQDAIRRFREALHKARETLQKSGTVPR
jgi:hypothetical protein